MDENIREIIRIERWWRKELEDYQEEEIEEELEEETEDEDENDNEQEQSKKDKKEEVLNGKEARGDEKRGEEETDADDNRKKKTGRTDKKRGKDYEAEEKETEENGKEEENGTRTREREKLYEEYYGTETDTEKNDETVIEQEQKSNNQNNRENIDEEKGSSSKVEESQEKQESSGDDKDEGHKPDEINSDSDDIDREESSEEYKNNNDENEDSDIEEESSEEYGEEEDGDREQEQNESVGVRNSQQAFNIEYYYRRRLAIVFSNIISKIAEDLTGLPKEGDDEWDINAILMRKINRKPLFRCRQTREKRRVVLILDTSGSCYEQADFYSAIASVSHKLGDIELYLAPNASIEKKKEGDKWVDFYGESEEYDEYRYRWPFKNRKIIFFGDFDGGDSIVEASWDNDVYWFSCEARYKDMDEHDWCHYTLKDFKGKYYKCINEKDFINLLKKIRITEGRQRQIASYKYLSRTRKF